MKCVCFHFGEPFYDVSQTQDGFVNSIILGPDVLSSMLKGVIQHKIREKCGDNPRQTT